MDERDDRRRRRADDSSSYSPSYSYDAEQGKEKAKPRFDVRDF